jgi:cell division topological specificity factor
MINLLNYFRARRAATAAADSGALDSAKVAKERLQILVARDRTGIVRREYLPALQEEILAVIRKYVAVDPDAVQVQFDRHDDCEILEVNVTLPEVESLGAGAERSSGS